MTQHKAGRDLTVETSSGTVHGFLDRGVPNWRGVPYGRVAERFRPPLPATRGGDIAADRWGPISWQVPIYPGISWSLIHPNMVEAEDCLNLNVWSPGTDRPGSRPVLVWLHPGGHVYGSGSTPLMDAWVFAARHDIVVVTANYRLGPWGWLHLGGLDPRFEDGVNLPIQDQVLLLRWIRDNIARFGGSPDNVTLFGASSGASDVGTLLGVPAARGLFHKAALYSGNAEDPVPSDKAAALTEQFLSAAGPLARTPADLARLPNVGLRHIHRKLLRGGPVRYGPSLDGDLLPEPPLGSVAAGHLAEVPVLVSVTADEARMYDILAPDTVDRMYASLMGAEAAADHDEKIKVLSEKLFYEPGDRLLTALHAAGGRCWTQVFDYHPTVSPVAGFPVVAGRPVHGVDVSALFIDTDGSAGTELDRRVGVDEQRALVGLARDGDPGWPGWSPERPHARRIGPADPEPRGDQ